MAEVQQTFDNPSDCLIVGADIGSTAFMVAFRRPGEHRTELVSDWPGHDPQSQENSSSALPACLYYPPQPRLLPYWQRQLDVEKCSPDFDGGRVVEFWKAGLHPGTLLHSEVEAVANRVGVRVEQFAWDFTVLLLRSLFFDPGAVFKNQSHEALMTFSKPSSWLPEWFDVFVEAAESLGFRRSQIVFVSETEALVREFIKENSRNSLRKGHLPLFKEGDVVIVVDAGGYTIDMEVYVIERFEAGASHKTRIGPAGPAQSIRQGSETTWIAFQNYMRTELLLKGDYSLEEISDCIRQAKPQWRKKKTIFSMGEDNIPKYFKVPGIHADKERNPPFLEGKFPITWGIAKQFFDISIDTQIEALSTLISDCPKNPSALLVGGGYCALRYLQKRYKETFEESNLKIKCHFAINPKPMIPKGLVDMWVNPQITISRLLKDTYDIKTVFPYTNERQAHFPGAEIEIFPDPDEQVPSFVAHEILGRMGGQVPQDQRLTVDDHQKRRLYIDEIDDLCWTEEINKRKVDPGSAKLLLPSDPLMQVPAETIKLSIDLRKLLPSKSRLQHTSRTTKLEKGKQKKVTRYYVRYSITLQLRGETVEYWIQYEERVSNSEIKTMALQLNGNPDFVNLVTLQELGSCPRRIQENCSFSTPDLQNPTETSDEERSRGLIDADESGSMTASAQLSGDLAQQFEKARLRAIGNDADSLNDLGANADRPVNFSRTLQQALSQNRSIIGGPESQLQEDTPVVTTPPHGGFQGRPRRGLVVHKPDSTTPVGPPPRSALSLLDQNRKRQAPEEQETHVKPQSRIATRARGQLVKQFTLDEATSTVVFAAKKKAVRFC